MEIEKTKNKKSSSLNPNNMKDTNMEIANIFDTSLISSKKNDNYFKKALKLKRNFK